MKINDSFGPPTSAQVSRMFPQFFRPDIAAQKFPLHGNPPHQIFYPVGFETNGTAEARSRSGNVALLSPVAVITSPPGHTANHE